MKRERERVIEREKKRERDICKCSFCAVQFRSLAVMFIKVAAALLIAHKNVS